MTLELSSIKTLLSAYIIYLKHNIYFLILLDKNIVIYNPVFVHDTDLHWLKQRLSAFNVVRCRCNTIFANQYILEKLSVY